MEKKPRKPYKKLPRELLVNKRLHISLTQTEYQLLKNKCQRKNIPLTHFVRKLIINALRD